jgi:ParB family chromosome partitioning protein
LLAQAESAAGAANSALRTELDLALSARNDLEITLAAERESRGALERRLESLASATGAERHPTPARPSLPPLEVAAAQAKAFAYAGPEQHDGSPRGLTPDALDELNAGLAKAASPRAAARVALQVLGASTGWQGGAVWQPRDDGEFGCTETWSAATAGLEAWETMAWRTLVQDGLVPAAAGSGEPHWAATDDMLACPRSRSAAWAALDTLATVPVVHPDGRVLAVMELVRRSRDVADPELLASLTGLTVRLAERLETIDQTEAAHAARM